MTLTRAYQFSPTPAIASPYPRCRGIGCAHDLAQGDPRIFHPEASAFASPRSTSPFDQFVSRDEHVILMTMKW